ncbi:MAG: SDR family NAD(P)-dependent oxidoreductase [Acidimicrobiia bacterium]|nr:SDR family NAD(P)-dependent oxidoreductase [Acidimicrobiia bacterium]
MAEAFAGMTVVITGAAGGIGRELCAAFGKEGARVVAIDLEAGSLEAVAEAHTIDITDAAAVEAAIGRLERIDVLVHAAGITALGPLAETPLDAIDRVIDVNLRGAIIVTKVALPALQASAGRIGVLSSVSGFSPLLYRTAYAASKHGLHGFFESLRTELVDVGVSVTMICPSFVPTGIENRAAFRATGDTGGWTTTGELTSARALATMIVEAMAARRRLVLPSRTARLAWIVSRLAPARYEAAMRRRIRR